MENFTSLPYEAQEAILNRPALEPPKDIDHHPENPPNSNDLALAVIVICVALIGVCGALRLYSRMFVTKKLFVEDYLGFASYAPYAAGTWVYITYLDTGGFLVHQWDLTLRNYLELLHILLLLRITYCLVMMFAKAAILIEWIRIFIPRGTKNTFFYMSWALIIFNALFYAVAILVSVFSCLPTHKIWQPWVDGHCFDRRAADIATGWFNLAVDVFILLLPQHVIWKLQMSRARKFTTSLVFSIGLFIVACATGRLYSNMTLDYEGDTAYDASISFMWSFCELTGVLVVFCAPALPKAFSRPKLRKSFSSESSLPISERQSRLSRKKFWRESCNGDSRR